ncbi:DUF397 domain-containing protein [Streptomyces sp. NPDC059720]|uniref:DUF397 domain-containing protein n=1 Tax=Streptomyces sp. NPDC059720 TaxID=3346924 RepID=UPI0036B6117C
MIRNAEPAWFKSSYSSGTDGNSCVEVAISPGTVHVRDSKHTRGDRLGLSGAAWGAFVAGVPHLEHPGR